MFGISYKGVCYVCSCAGGSCLLADTPTGERSQPLLRRSEGRLCRIGLRQSRYVRRMIYGGGLIPKQPQMFGIFRMSYGRPTGCGSYNGPLDRDPSVVDGRGREVYHTSRLLTV